MKNCKVYFLYYIIFFVAIACDDDFVVVESKNQNTENYFNTAEEYELALIGAYDMLQSTYLNVMLGEIASDNTLAGGENATDTPGIQQIDDMIHTTSNQQLTDIWGWMFSGVNRANYILEFQDKIDFEGRLNIVAQARFLRAYYYFELVKWFGDVPLAVDSRITYGKQFELSRTPSSEVYNQIEKDLIFAVENLPVEQEKSGKATKGAAQALLGKAYLFQDKFELAADVLDDLINSEKYNLVEDFSTLFENNNENNVESIFEVQYTDLEGASFDCLQCSEGNVAVGFQGVRSYSGPIFESGFSFNVPTDETYKTFREDDLRRDYSILNINLFAEQNADYNNGAGVTYGEGFEHTGYFNRKYIPRKGDSNIGDPNLTNPNNYRSIRYSDVLLMAAESHNRKPNPNDEKALFYLNQVIERAFGNTSQNLSNGGNALTKSIWEQRRLELVGEGHRFFDLVRTGQAKEKINGFVENKHELFPIPSIEIELTGNRWEQNPGY